MPSVWIARRQRKGGGVSFRVLYRLGGRESAPRYAGSFRTLREARIRRDLVAGELAALRVPDLKRLSEAPAPKPTLAEVARRWQASRRDVREATRIQHRTALARVLPLLGARPVDEITLEDVQALVDHLAAEGKARESIRKSRTALAMVLDYARVEPNPARSRLVRLPLAEPEEVEPPIADHVEAVASLLSPPYLLALLTLDATGARIGELAAARVGDLDEARRAWLVRARVAKTRRPRWVELPDDLFAVLLERLPPREDRDPQAPLFPIGSADRLRMAILRACRAAGVPEWSPHELRHRRISLLHHQGLSWAEIGARVGQRNLSVTADTYTHALIDYREIDRGKLLERVRAVQTPVQTSGSEDRASAGVF
ncbi:MAG: site-specific integrase [Thermoleophilia bacterium]|nr:tyrosine-type recombinase/integrase [Gaiellaceae bacterium]MDW8338979.1 site-specific integrase [Thermoleophilia bacterium]